MRSNLVELPRLPSSLRAAPPEHRPLLGRPDGQRSSLSYDLHKRAALRLAACIEGDAPECERWFAHEAIAALNGRTAEQVVRDGEGDALMSFLADVICLDRNQDSR